MECRGHNIRCHGKALTLADASLGAQQFFPFQRWEEMNVKLKLGGGFQYLLFSPLLGEDFQFDYIFFSKGLKPPTSTGWWLSFTQTFWMEFSPRKKIGEEDSWTRNLTCAYFSIGLVRFNHQVDWNVMSSDDFWWHLKVRSSFVFPDILKASEGWWWSVPTGLHGVVAKEMFLWRCWVWGIVHYSGIYI